MTAPPRPPADIWDYLGYDPLTGNFWWKSSSGGPAKAGKLAGPGSPKSYSRITFRGVKYRAHRLAWFYVTGEWVEGLLDHKNLNKADNRFLNLREANHSQNMSNTTKRPGCSSSYKGVTRVRSGRWQAQIGLSKKRHQHLGTFDTEEEAAAAYRAAAVAAFGEFARME